MKVEIKWIIGIVVIILIIVGIVASDEKKPRGDISESVKIGVILPLTGNLANVGEEIRIALSLAEESLKNDYPNVEIIFEDDGFDPKRSVDAFIKLVDVDNVDFVIGPLNGSSIEAIKPIAQEKKIVAFTPWGAGNHLSDYVYKNSVEADAESQAILEYASNELGMKSIAILYLNNDWGVSHYNSVKENSSKFGVELVASETLNISDTDFRTQLLKIEQADPDGIFIVHTGALPATISRQAKELGIETQLLGQYGTESGTFIDVGGQSVEGTIYSFPIDEKNLNEKQETFINKFVDIYKNKPQVAAYNAYDIYSLAVPIIYECEKESGCINEKVGSLSNFDGVGGIFSLNSGMLERNFYFKKVLNGEFVSVGE